ncbi:unnamed protein product [Darwinula stevensoni]|uniref:Uncharacterized protein n=1 Tax=Darwinula stevensoni TaxID=69355 RepID=A0A7R8XF72_9CRUS|nr:unnamed protein product [Darwinula stevensoni]CAG0890402.1 unnamed protein product [Darwinula stevensoni]
MTKTYNDIDAVTKLLEEKEKDLELAARIGQQLLGRNHALEDRIAALEGELALANDTCTQLRHELQLKSELLHIYNADGDPDSEAGTPQGVRLFNLELFQRRVKALEEENTSLRQETLYLQQETSACESKERDLINDVAKELCETKLQVKCLSEELAKKIDENFRQQEELTSLLAQLIDHQTKGKKLSAENEELSSHLLAAKEAQLELTTELADFKLKYAEVLALLRDTQEQLKQTKEETYSGPLPWANNYFNPESLAAEIEQSLAEEIHQECQQKMSATIKKVFETFRCVNKTPVPPSYLAIPTQALTNPSSPYMPLPCPIQSSTTIMSWSNQSYPSFDSALFSDSDLSGLTDEESLYPSTSKAGVPGYPGSKDLQTALQKLDPLDVYKRRDQLGSISASDWETSPSDDLSRSPRPTSWVPPPPGCRTPDSIMSLGSLQSQFSSKASANPLNQWKASEKLQLVKPFEGSMTLHQWSRLATPHMATVLDERPGIQHRSTATAGLFKNSLKEELEDAATATSQETPSSSEVINPGKAFGFTNSVYTYTNSTVLHPDDTTLVTPSLQRTHMSSKVKDEFSLWAISRKSAALLKQTFIGDASRTGSLRKKGSRRLSSSVSSEGSPSAAPSTGYQLVDQVEKIGLTNLMASPPTFVPMMFPGGPVCSRSKRSPMMQLTSLKALSQRPGYRKKVPSGDEKQTNLSSGACTSSEKKLPSRVIASTFGVPGKPGSGILATKLRQFGKVRPDLGKVTPRKPVSGKEEDSGMGTLSFLSFGRKGGLL